MHEDVYSSIVYKGQDSGSVWMFISGGIYIIRIASKKWTRTIAVALEEFPRGIFE